MFTGLVPPRYRGHRVIDGGYSDNVPVLDQHTVTVSPFSGGAHICPHHPEAPWVNVANTILTLNTDNLVRASSVLFPPSQDILASYCYQGYSDAFKFIQSREMIPPLKKEDIQKRENIFQSVVKTVKMIFFTVNVNNNHAEEFEKSEVLKGGLQSGLPTIPGLHFLLDFGHFTLQRAKVVYRIIINCDGRLCIEFSPAGLC